jgi:hypothetical protein
MAQGQAQPPEPPDGQASHPASRSPGLVMVNVDGVFTFRPAPRPPLLTARRVLAALLLAGALGAVGLGAHDAGWLAFLSPAPKWETAGRASEEGPPGASPADALDPGDLTLGPKERASYPDEPLALLAAPEQKRTGPRRPAPTAAGWRSRPGTSSGCGASAAPRLRSSWRTTPAPWPP